MHVRISFFIVLTCLVLLAGCGSSSTPEDLSGRLSAAQEITDTSKRDSTLADVAKDAGKAGNGVVASDAIAKISSSSLRDTTAADVAVALAAAGDSAAATQVAKQISSTTQRNSVLEQIATD